MNKGMLSLSSDEEADVVNPEDKKGLANLFGNDRMSAASQKPSLHYTAPKQPKPERNKSVSRDGVQSVVIAVPISAQQYINGQYVNKDRVSLAVLGSAVSKEYTLIIYKTQTDRRLTLRIEATLNFNVKENNFVNFYDDTRQAWAVKFDSTKDLYEVAFAIALSKAHMTGLRTLLLQNLQIGEGQAVANGDTVGVYYTAWVFSSGTIMRDKPFDSNVNSDKIYKFKVGDKAVIPGWDQGMVGMKRGGKKLILIPPKLAYAEKGVKGRIPPNACLVYEVELVKAKFLLKDADTRDFPLLPSTDDSDSSVSAHDRASEDHSDGSDITSKEAILKRLAKVAQPIFPQRVTQDFMPSQDVPPQGPRVVTSESSGRSTPVSVGSNPAPYPPYEQHYSHPDPYYQHPRVPYTHQVPFPPVPPPIYPPQPSTALAPISYPTQLPFPGHHALLAAQQGLAGPTIIQAQPQMQAPQQGVGVGEYSQLMADTKVELGKMSLRLDEIGKKVDHIHESSTKSLVPVQQESQRGGLLDPGVLLHSINKIVDENTHLKREVLDRDSRMEGLNQRINQLLQSNQRYVEQSQQLLEQRSDSMHSMASNQQSRLSQIEIEKNELVVKFEEAKRNLDQKNLEVTEYMSESEEIKRKYENVMQKMTLAKEKFREKESEIEELRSDCEQAKRESEKAKSSHNKLTSEIEDLSSNLEELRDKVKHDKSMKIKLDSKLTGYEDEISELKEENEQLQRSVEERKRKFLMEKQKLQSEVEELRNTHEEEIQSIKSHLNSTSSGPSPIEIAKIESSWKRKLDQAVADTEARNQDQIEELQSNEHKLKASIQRLEKKVHSTQNSDNQLNEQTEQMLELQDQLRVAQEKFNRAQGREQELSEQLNEFIEREVILNKRLHRTETENSSLGAQLQEARVMLSHKSAGYPPDAGINRDQLEAKIKLIMNQLFQVMRTKFDLSESYDGNFIITTIMQTIKQETVRQLQPPESDTESEAEPDSDASGDGEPPADEVTDSSAVADQPAGVDDETAVATAPTQESESTLPSSPPTHQRLPQLGSPPGEQLSNQYVPSYEPVTESLPSATYDPPAPESVNRVSSSPPEPPVHSMEPPPMHDPLISSPPSTNPLSTSPPAYPTSPPVPNPLSSPTKSSQEPISNPLLGGNSYSESDFFLPISSRKEEKPLPSQSTVKQKQPGSSALFSDDEGDEFDWLN